MPETYCNWICETCGMEWWNLENVLEPHCPLCQGEVVVSWKPWPVGVEPCDG
jgi:hypothetical protein